jgi:hypothetical protein
MTRHTTSAVENLAARLPGELRSFDHWHCTDGNQPTAYVTTWRHLLTGSATTGTT